MTIEELRRLAAEKAEEARGFLNDGKTKEAEEKMEELRALKSQIKIAEELEDEEKRSLETQRDLNTENRDKADVDEMRAIAKFLLRQDLTDEERAVVKISDNAAVVPKQFINELEELRKGYGSLKHFCHIIPVTSESGTKPVIDLDQGDELPIILEGNDIEDDSLATSQLDFKVVKIGKLIRLSSELVDDAVVDMESLAKTVFLEKAVRSENSRILNTINSSASKMEVVAGEDEHKTFAKEMDSQVPSVRHGLVTLVNTKLYAKWKNAEDKQGRNLNLITVGSDGQEYFHGKPIAEFDDSLIKDKAEEGETYIAYMLNFKEAVKFFDRKEISFAKADKFENDTKMLRILERIDVKKGSNRSIKKLVF